VKKLRKSSAMKIQIFSNVRQAEQYMWENCGDGCAWKDGKNTLRRQKNPES
jgi:hypothetical protein